MTKTSRGTYVTQEEALLTLEAWPESGRRRLEGRREEGILPTPRDYKGAKTSVLRRLEEEVL